VGRGVTGVNPELSSGATIRAVKPTVIALAVAAAFVAFAADLALIQPKEMAARVGQKDLMVIHVGPNVLYRSKHIPGSVYAGPGNMAKGLELLKAAVEKLPRTQEIAIYCGCCPWDVCPNIKPAAELLRGMGFTKVKAMYLHTNFKTDWIDQGFPTEPR